MKTEAEMWWEIFSRRVGLQRHSMGGGLNQFGQFGIQSEISHSEAAEYADKCIQVYRTRYAMRAAPSKPKSKRRN